MSRDKEVGEVVSAIIYLVNNQYSFLVELQSFLIAMFARKRLVKKTLLLLMSSESKMQNGKKEAGAHHLVISNDGMIS